MSYGVVKTMHRGMFNTPNKGTLLDLATNVVYDFVRPDTDGSVEPRAWTVEVHDLVSYTLVDGVPTNVTLYKKYQKGTVYSQ